MADGRSVCGWEDHTSARMRQSWAFVTTFPLETHGEHLRVSEGGTPHRPEDLLEAAPFYMYTCVACAQTSLHICG